jgi:hypothetical protein
MARIAALFAVVVAIAVACGIVGKTVTEPATPLAVDSTWRSIYSCVAAHLKQ